MKELSQIQSAGFFIFIRPEDQDTASAMADAVAVKPPQLNMEADRRPGERLFVPVSDPLEKVKHITCHELTHAFTARLRLSPWLNEGLAMRAVDHLAGRLTVLPETEGSARSDPWRLSTRAYRRVAARDHDALVELYAAGYWVARRLDEGRVGEVRSLLAKRRRNGTLNRRVRRTLRSFPDHG